jgi:hypothetical protein
MSHEIDEDIMLEYALDKGTDFCICGFYGFEFIMILVLNGLGELPTAKAASMKCCTLFHFCLRRMQNRGRQARSGASGDFVVPCAAFKAVEPV